MIVIDSLVWISITFKQMFCKINQDYVEIIFYNLSLKQGQHTKMLVNVC